MNSEIRFTLEKYTGIKSRHACPACGKRHEFSRYVDTATGEYLADHVGRCNREGACNYHFKPADYFKAGGQAAQVEPIKREIKPVQPDFIPGRILAACMASDKPNNFEIGLRSRYPAEVVNESKAKYFYGTCNDPFKLGTVFFYLDEKGSITRGDIMVYHAETLKKQKYDTGPMEGKPRISSIVKCLKLKGAGESWEYKQTLYGAHLLRAEPNKPVAIVEAPKSAIIGSIYFPQFVWLATGGLSKLKPERVQVLKGRKVVCFPDLGGEAVWQKAIDELQHIATFTLSTFLTNNATDADRAAKLDIADYLIRFPLSEFRQPAPAPAAKAQACEPSPSVEPIAEPAAEIEPAFTMAEAYREVKEFFTGVNLDGLQSVWLNAYTFIERPALFVNTHLSIVERNLRNRRFESYLNRLQQLQIHLTNN